MFVWTFQFNPVSPRGCSGFSLQMRSRSWSLEYLQAPGKLFCSGPRISSYTHQVSKLSTSLQREAREARAHVDSCFSGLHQRWQDERIIIVIRNTYAVDRFVCMMLMEKKKIHRVVEFPGAMTMRVVLNTRRLSLRRTVGFSALRCQLAVWT